REPSRWPRRTEESAARDRRAASRGSLRLRGSPRPGLRRAPSGSSIGGRAAGYRALPTGAAEGRASAGRRARGARRRQGRERTKWPLPPHGDGKGASTRKSSGEGPKERMSDPRQSTSLGGGRKDSDRKSFARVAARAWVQVPSPF